MDLAGRLAAFTVGTPLVAVAALLALVPPKVDLVVVNGTGAPLLVRVAGRSPARVEAGAALSLEGLPAGRRRLLAETAPATSEVRAAPWQAVTVDDLTGDLVAGLGAPRPTYVWDVAAATSFAVVSWGYGDRSGERGAAPFTPKGPLFVLPAAYVPGVDASFPEKAQVPTGTKGALRQALWTRARLAREAEVVLLVDDGVGSNLRLEVDGERKALVRGGQTLSVLGVPPGRHVLRAVEVRVDGVETGRVFALEAALEAEPFAPPAVWVWNVNGAQQRYLVLSRAFGRAPDQPSSPIEPMDSPGELFRLPAGFLPGLNSELPERSRPGVVKALWTPLGLELRRSPFGGSGETPADGLEGKLKGMFGDVEGGAAPPAPR